jgi:hypothetical protein
MLNKWINSEEEVEKNVSGDKMVKECKEKWNDYKEKIVRKLLD